MTTPTMRMVAWARPWRNGLTLAVAAGALALSCAIGLFAVSGFLIARAAEHPAITDLAIAIVAVRALGIGRAVFRYGERLATHSVALRVLADVRVSFYRRLERALPVALDAERRGDLLHRLVSDVDAVQDLIVRGVVPTLAGALAGGAAVVVTLVLFRPAAAALGAGLLVAGVVLPVMTLVATRHPSRAVAAGRGRLGADVVDIVTAAPDLVAFGAEEHALERVAEVDAHLTRLSRRYATIFAAGSGLATLVAGVTVWSVLVVGVAATSHGTLDRVPLAVITLAALAAFETTQPLPAAAAALTSARAAATRVATATTRGAAATEPSRPRVIPSGPVTVRIRGARVRYAETGPWVLDGVDLDLTPGRRVAIVGPSGSGKSTLIAVLLRFLDLREGTVTLDDVPLGDYASDDVRRVISGVTHDPHIFATTVRDNISLARPGATDDDIAGAARRAGLLDWVHTLPDGWSTRLGTDGALVAGGERQRIALARALLADPQVLVLDEPTAHLDPVVRTSLLRDLLAVTSGRSTVLVTHDPIGLDAVDEVVVLDQGVVRHRGTHAELLRRAAGYGRMWRDRPAGV